MRAFFCEYPDSTRLQYPLGESASSRLKWRFYGLERLFLRSAGGVWRAKCVAFRVVRSTFLGWVDVRMPNSSKRKNRRDPTMTLAEILESQFFEHQFAKVRSKKTKGHYRRAVKWLGESLGRDATIEDLNDDGVRRVMVWLGECRGQLPITINTTRKFLVALAKWLREEGKIDRVPRVPKLAEPHHPPESLTIDQLRSLWHVATTRRGNIIGIPAAVWWPTLLWVEFDTAVRAGELLSIRWDWIDWASRIIRTPPDARKGGRRGEVYRFGPECLRWLRELQACSPPGEGYVFGNPSTKTYYAHWERIQKAAGLPAGRRWKTHALRRTVATFVAVAGGDPARVLRHSSPKMAWDHYVDPIPSAVAASSICGKFGPEFTHPAGVVAEMIS